MNKWWVILLLAVAAWFSLGFLTSRNTAVRYEIRTAASVDFLVTHWVACKGWGGLETGRIYPRCGLDRLFLANNTPHTFRTKPEGSVRKARVEFFHPLYSALELRFDLAPSRFPPRYHAEFAAFEPIPVESVMEVQRFALTNGLTTSSQLLLVPGIYIQYPTLRWGTEHLSYIASRYLPRAYIEQRELPDVRGVVARVAEHNRWLYDYIRRHPGDGAEAEFVLHYVGDLEVVNAAYEKLIYQILDVYDVDGPRPNWPPLTGTPQDRSDNGYERDRKALEGIFPYVPRSSSLKQLRRVLSEE